MAYRIHNGRLQQGFWVSGINGPHRGWVDCGPAPELRRGDRALAVMANFERRNRTVNNRWYEIARAIALSDLFGIKEPTHSPTGSDYPADYFADEQNRLFP